MRTEKINVFIVADNILVVSGLKHYLEGRFGNNIHIHSFYNKKSCLRELDHQTDMVIVDYFIEGKSATEWRGAIKTINSKVEIILHISKEQVESCIDVFIKKRIKLLKDRITNSYTLIQ